MQQSAENLLTNVAHCCQVAKNCANNSKGASKNIFVEELCSEFVLMEKYFFPKPLKNTNMTLKKFWYFEDFFSNCLGNL